MTYLCVRTSDYKPRYFICKNQSVSSLCTNKCVFNSAETVEFLSKISCSHLDKSDIKFYKIPENYSFLGKTPMEFLEETQGIKFNNFNRLSTRQKQEVKIERKKKKTSTEIEQNSLF